jgi:peptidoglycan/xylan/chitin deacetylase (PgdA/CDA1 family)/glycosyltransferase involved in cell wall biosynthesis
LLVGFLVVLLGLLSLNGYILHVGSEGNGPVGPPPGDPPGPAAVDEGGPVVRADATGTVTTRSMPAHTIALTFDDGPDPQWTPKILAILAKYGAHATFFVVGSRVNADPDLARRIVAEGNEIGVHTFTHIDLATSPTWQASMELTLTRNAIAAATGTVPVLLRPPYSSTPDSVTQSQYAAIRRAGAAGYLVVLADRDTEDWRRPGVNAIVAAATPTGGAGAVVMMHDSGGDRSQTVAALNVLLPALKAQGYRFSTVSGALNLAAGSPATTGERVRGQLLRWTQVSAGWLATGLTWLMFAALALALLRLAVQLACAALHRRRHDMMLPWDAGLVSIVVPAYNEEANIAAAVRSLAASRYPRVEVIVVDDGSTDATADIVAGLGLRNVHLICQPNRGKPAALNTGIAYAHGEVLVLVDGDTVLAPDAIARLVRPLRDPAVGAVAGNTKVANRGGLLGRWQHLEYVVGFNLDRRLFDVASCMPTVPGAIGAFRRRAIAAVGGVPDQTLAEDTDVTMAVARAGWRIAYAPDAIAWTEAPATMRQLWRQRYRWSYGTMQAMWKHRRAVFERGASGRLGRRGLLYLLLFQILLPLCAPMVDIYGVYGAMFLPAVQVIAVWGGFMLLQVVTAAYALHLDRERFGPLWSLPLQQVVYRQLLYLVVVQSTVMALVGSRLRWQRMHRTGAVAERAAARP